MFVLNKNQLLEIRVILPQGLPPDSLYVFVILNINVSLQIVDYKQKCIEQGMSVMRIDCCLKLFFMEKVFCVYMHVHVTD